MYFSVATAVMIVIIGFASIRNYGKQVNDVQVVIRNQHGDLFTDHLEVLDLLNAQRTDYVLGLHIRDIDLKLLESRVEMHPFVKDAQVYRDVKGNLVVTVSQNRPIARIFDRKGEDLYIDENGTLLPTTSRHTARVPIVELEKKFDWEHNITETRYGQKILEVLRYIDSDEFWKAQIAHLVVHKDGELTLLPQVTKQEVVFGMPDDLDRKFKKLKIFYKEILPNKGWNTYSMVNLKFENQIVCE